MDRPDHRRLTTRVATRPNRGASGAPLVAALPALLVLFGCLLAPAATASAVPPGLLGQALSARAGLQQAELTAADGASDDLFGESVAISGDTALVGAPWHDIAGLDMFGAAYVFVRSGTTWTQRQKLTAPDGSWGDMFGASVALSGDTALVGAPGHDPNDGGVARDGAGAAYVFELLPWEGGTRWVLRAKLIGDEGDGAGASVAISGDTALVGATQHDTPGGLDAGAAFVFTRSGANWTSEGELTAADGATDDFFGKSVALVGNTALVGAPYHDGVVAADAGAAYVFTRSGGAWAQHDKLAAADGATNDFFGYSVALSGSLASQGCRALVGAHTHDVGSATDAGAAYVFNGSPSGWTRAATLIARDGAANDLFGSSVALSGDTALVCAPGHGTHGTPNLGAAYFFVPVSSSWRQEAQFATVNTGWAAALAGDTALVGGPYHVTGTGVMTGAVHVIVRTAGTWAPPPPTAGSVRPASASRGATVTISGSGFGATRGTGFVKFGTRKCAGYVSWSDTAIRCKVPSKARFGRVKVRVTTAAGTSNARTFTVKR